MRWAEKPWNDPAASIPRDIHFPKGMLGSEERNALYWFARELVSGEGQVIDAGAFLGASAYALAAGLDHSPRRNARRTKVHSYDTFVAFEKYTADWVASEFGGGLGDPFRDIFVYQVGAHRDRIVPHEGDILGEAWSGEPIEILFIDLAKSKKLNGHIAQEWFSHLIPNHSIVLNQDFFLSRHPWIPITMEFLKDHFVVIDPLIQWCTRAYRLVSPVPPEKLARIVSYDFTRAEERALLASYLAGEPDGPLLDMAKLISITDHLLAGDHDLARNELRGLEMKDHSKFDSSLRSEFDWVKAWYATITQA